MPDTATIQVQPDATIKHLLHVRLHNPKRRNAVSHDMWQLISQTFDKIAGDDDVRAVVLSGSGDAAFCAGADISEFGHWRSTEPLRQQYQKTTHAGAFSLAQFPKPIIGAIRGFCIGAGFEIAAQCDIRLCANDARFAVTPARLGLGYGLDDTQLLVDRFGASTAREMLFTGRMYDASEALRLGIVSQSVAAENLDDAVAAIASEIVGNAPLTILASKAIVNEALKPATQQDTELCQRLVRRCYDSDDFQEGQAAFQQKRKPQFNGR